ncbi:hypothetical protein G6F57_004126 [Rhizopus arrhizus]|uniref:Methyltransferase domain-containing protein n=1 Tax=Rhizopus oryzae TaxID=64495 RepID=A0A9P7BUU3_RHIOR|nr:hypothetical protein G6F23_001808 [Rhizopus arrhizus]KAG1420991.1 hypothetical protein G6F58_003948 [Rhizopus delemar]KAG0766046.1 hypothetical protein G6F24_003921 [Rhizopus arrhizus]KAG0782111.1 hypothetical protein G6F22_009257 [Rhizopus arrhizus]KAG0792842.1 hypothetical protein G6F21_004058 [Rhizopus arrhizus]
MSRNILKDVCEKLDFKKGISVLDVGCGSGAWILDMVSDYPNCTYEGCDIEDVTNKRLSLKQTHFRTGNVLQGLPYPDNSFDFVHMRLLILAFKVEEWPMAIAEILRMTGNEAVQRILNEIHAVCQSRGQDPRIALKLKNMVAENKHARSVKADYRSVDMASNSMAAKRFIWDWIETVKSMLPVVGSRMGLESKKDQDAYFRELQYGLTHSDAYTYMNAVVAEKA